MCVCVCVCIYAYLNVFEHFPLLSSHFHPTYVHGLTHLRRYDKWQWRTRTDDASWAIRWWAALGYEAQYAHSLRHCFRCVNLLHSTSLSQSAPSLLLSLHPTYLPIYPILISLILYSFLPTYFSPPSRNLSPHPPSLDPIQIFTLFLILVSFLLKGFGAESIVFAAALSLQRSIFRKTNFTMKNDPTNFNQCVRISFLGTSLCMCVYLNVHVGSACMHTYWRDCLNCMIDRV